MQSFIYKDYGGAKMAKKKLLCALICALACIAGVFFAPSLPVAAAQSVSDLEQLEKVFAEAVKDGENPISFTASSVYTTTQIHDALQNAAKKQNKLLVGGFHVSRRSYGTGSSDYTITLPEQAWVKIKVLKSKSEAIKAAAKALKGCKYTTNYYSEKSYYDVFQKTIRQHPEYNYGTLVWRNTNGTYGYRRGSGLTEKQQDAQMKAADTAAAKAVKKLIKANMTDKQKAKAIHNYIVKNCIYSITPDSFTAYGALVGGTAVCQGYAAAFNLMATKCGLRSITVCGTARGVSHAWTYAKIGSKYRYIDCTWDDTDGIGTGIVYTYFNVSAEKMREGHVWNEADYPASDIKYYKYFK